MQTLMLCPVYHAGRENHGQEVTIAAMSLTGGEDIRKLQREDDTLGPVIQAIQSGERPNTNKTKELSRETRRLFQLWDQLQLRDNILHRQYEKTDKSSIVLQLLVPNSKKEEVLHEMHEGTLGGHLGEEKTLEQVKERYYWPGYYSDVSNWCRTCSACAQKTPAPKNRTPLQSIKIGSPLQLVAVDIVGPLPEWEHSHQ